MENRRNFLKKSLMAAAILSAPSLQSCINISPIRSKVPMKPDRTGKVLVCWYSQTGFTERTGKLLADEFRKLGKTVVSSEIRDFDKQQINGFDLILLGAPVFYYDVPDYVKDWIKTIPSLNGAPVAAFVTFGGPEGNQHNSACSIIQCLAEKDGVPVGIETFMNMSSFPLSWAGDEKNAETWLAGYQPDEKTHKKVREYAGHLIRQVEQGKESDFSKNITLREFVTYFGPAWWTKRLIDNHSIDRDKCIGCGTCAAKCPVSAISLSDLTVDTQSCVLCFGCINNCPARAVHMEYKGEALVGFNELIQRANLKMNSPT